ncbi:protein ImuB [Rhizobium sp. RU20A]|nr:protein ImuB [Rhizobium sp. RU20A]
MRIAALDRVAEGAGLRPGLGIAEARAMLPKLDVMPADPAADRSFLAGIADWCDRYTPLVGIDGSDGLFLDITGCAHLHGGEKALMADLLARLFHLGLEARATIAATPGLAWALARFGAAPAHIVDAGAEEEMLVPLPLASLRLPADMRDGLARLGLVSVHDILTMPRAPLVRRFGPLPLLRLDQALGREDEPISPRRPVALLAAERRLASPVVAQDDILAITLSLATSLRPGLEARGQGGRTFELQLFRIDSRVFRLAVGASAPLADPARIAGLFRERLAALHDDIDAGFGFEMLQLRVLSAESATPRQTDLATAGAEDRPLTGFIDQVTARLGPESLEVMLRQESHVPERAASFLPATEAPSPDAPIRQKTPLAARAVAAIGAVRPLRLFARPEPVEATAEVPEGPPMSFRWRRALYRVRHAEGPERIASEWWIDGEDWPVRDYFRVEDVEGRRFWLFREGFFSDITMPRWFLHGLFA